MEMTSVASRFFNSIVARPDSFERMETLKTHAPIAEHCSKTVPASGVGAAGCGRAVLASVDNAKTALYVALFKVVPSRF
jgi:hypothetical protein